MPNIAILNQETIDKIAAGEVVERPCSVVKELVENAIDAGSTAITVEIKEGGISFIRITDNGCGPDEEQLALLQATLENKELLEQERRARKRIGLVNIQSRLKLMYGDAGGLTFGRKEGMTIVTVKLPIDIQEGR